MAIRTSMIVLAAGASRRTGSENKLLLPFNGRTILESTLTSILAVDTEEVIVVTGYEADRLAPFLSLLPVRIVHNADYGLGMSTSIRAGVLAARGAVGICLADMPFIDPGTVKTLVQTLELRSDSIILPFFQGQPGHPVLFGERFKEELIHLDGDKGARSIIETHGDDVVRVDTRDPGILRDIDTVEEYQQALKFSTEY